jgi:hypothetical protein
MAAASAAVPCPCGDPHTGDPRLVLVDQFVERSGPTVEITTHAGCWRVPRIWVALHGLKAWELPALADRYGWPAV